VQGAAVSARPACTHGRCAGKLAEEVIEPSQGRQGGNICGTMLLPWAMAAGAAEQHG
jgi:hypothetical protein